METEFIVSIIATLGVIVSALLSYYISFRTIKTEQKKTNYEIQSTFYNQITASRIEGFKLIYNIISEFAKDIRAEGMFNTRRKVDRESLVVFITKYDIQDSMLSILFSSKTSGCSFALRNMCYQILKDTSDDNFQEVFYKLFRLPLIDVIGTLEAMLKADIGVFTLEYKDFDGSLDSPTKEDLKKIKDRLNKYQTIFNQQPLKLLNL